MPPTETGYRIYQVLDDGSLLLLTTLPANATSFSNTVANYSSHRYAIQAIDAAGNLGDLSYTAPFQVGSTFEDRKNHLLDHLNTDVPNLGQFGGGPHRIGRTGFWYGNARMQRGDTTNGINYITTAVEDASAENSNAGFSLWPGMDSYLRWNGSFPQSLKDRYQQVYTTSDLYDNSATPNQRFMTCTASYLANSVWGPSVNSVSSASYATGDPTGKAYLEGVINNVPFRGYPEHNSTQYLVYTVGPMMTLADFAPDPVFKNKARMALDWAMAEAASGMQNGRWVTPVTRGRVAATQEGYSNTGFAWWLLYGGPLPGDMLDSSNATVLTSPTFTGLLPELTRAATERTQSFTRRTFAQRSAGPQLAYFKQTWTTPTYALTSQVEGTVSGFNPDGSIILSNLNTTAIQDGYQGQRWSLNWDDAPAAESSLYLTTPTTYSGTTGGISIYEDTLQHEDTMLAVYNIPATGGTGGNNGDWPNQWIQGRIPGGDLARIDEAATTGRLFLHYKGLLVSIYLSNPFTWSSSPNIPCTKAGLAIETAPQSEYPQATAADRLAAFRADVLANSPDIAAINDAAPRIVYTNRHGRVLDLTYGLAGKIDGVTVDYQSWPMLEDPWMYQAQNGHLHLFGPNRVVTSNYYDWTKSINNRPTPASAAAVPATTGTPVEIDLAARVADSETPDNQLHFTVSNPSNGSVTLLPDGKTARFTPTASGPASFDFTTRDRGIHPRVIWHYDFESTATRDASGHNRDATQTLVGTGTASLESDTSAALGSNSTQSLRLTEATPNAAKLSRLVTRSNLEMSNGSWTFATWFKRASRTTDDFLFYIGAGDGFSGNGDELQLRCGGNADTLRLEHYNAANAGDLTLDQPRHRRAKRLAPRRRHLRENRRQHRHRPPLPERHPGRLTHHRDLGAAPGPRARPRRRHQQQYQLHRRRTILQRLARRLRPVPRRDVGSGHRQPRQTKRRHLQRPLRQRQRLAFRLRRIALGRLARRELQLHRTRRSPHQRTQRRQGPRRHRQPPRIRHRHQSRPSQHDPGFRRKERRHPRVHLHPQQGRHRLGIPREMERNPRPRLLEHRRHRRPESRAPRGNRHHRDPPHPRPRRHGPPLRPPRSHPAMIRRLIVAVILACLLSGVLPAQSADLDVVKQRIVQSLSTGLAGPAVVQGHQSALQADGTWPDIDYASTAQTYWPPRNHLERMKSMAKEYVWGSLQGDTTLRDDIFRAFDAWILRDPQSTNWWYQQLNTPQVLRRNPAAHGKRGLSIAPNFRPRDDRQSLRAEIDELRHQYRCEPRRPLLRHDDARAPLGGRRPDLGGFPFHGRYHPRQQRPPIRRRHSGGRLVPTTRSPTLHRGLRLWLCARLVEIRVLRRGHAVRLHPPPEPACC